VIKYSIPRGWIHYDAVALTGVLSEAKAAVLSLRTIPYQRRWVEALQQIELKREVAGTSRIEGAEFTERELDAALKESPEQLRTRSQRQAHAAVQTYRWISGIPIERPIDNDLIREIHRRM
jgi:Fic family protein